MNETPKNPFQPHTPVKPGFAKPKHAHEVEDFHKRSDVDSSDRAQHHTLGYNSGQAAPGAQLKALVEAGAFGRIGDYQWNDTDTETEVWKLANGQLLNIADYPDAFDHFGTTYGGNGTTTFGLPDIRQHVLAMPLSTSTHGFNAAVGTKIGGGSHNAAHSHTHTGHTHTGPSHTHGIQSQDAHDHSISGQTADPTPASPGGAAGSVPRHVHYEGHAHGGVTGTGGQHSHGGATDAGGTGNTGSTADSTNGTTFTNPSFGGLLGNSTFSQIQFTFLTNCFVRVKLSI